MSENPFGTKRQELKPFGREKGEGSAISLFTFGSPLRLLVQLIDSDIPV